MIRFMRTLLYINTVIILSLTFTSCSEPTADVQIPQESAAGEPLEITFAFWDAENQFDSGNDPILQYIENRFNVTFTPVPISNSNWSQDYLVMASSDGLPDVFAHDIAGTSVYYNWIEEALIQPIPKDLSPYPNIERIFSLPDVKVTRHDDGNYYMIPRQTYQDSRFWAMDRVMMVRKDWMETLGIDDPTSFEAFKTMLTRFVTEDPDGNGIDDTEGLVVKNTRVATQLFLGSYPELANLPKAWIKKDAKWIPAYADPKTADALDEFRQLYSEGLITEDFAVQSASKSEDLFAQGRVGVFFTAHTYSYAQEYWEKYNDSPFTDHVKYLRMWPAPDGQIYKFTESTWWSESYFSNSCSPQKMKRLLEIYDWMLSEEGILTCRLGIPGKDWHQENGELVLTRPKNVNGDFIPMQQYSPASDALSNLAAWHQDIMYDKSIINTSVTDESFVDMAIDELNWHHQNSQSVNYNYNVCYISTPAKERLSQIDMFDEFTQIILSDVDTQTAYEAMLKKLEDHGLYDAIAEVTEAAAKLGY